MDAAQTLGSRPSLTRRGVGVAFAAHALLALLSILLASTGRSSFLALALLAVVGLGAAASLALLWEGRREFGGDRTRPLGLSMFCFAATGALLFLFSVSVATTVPSTLRPADLRAAAALLPILVVLEAVANLSALWPLASGMVRGLLVAFSAGSAAAAAVVATTAFRLVDDLVLRFGEVVQSSATGHQVVETFVENILPLWMLGVLATRALIGASLWNLLGSLVRAERATSAT